VAPKSWTELIREGERNLKSGQYAAAIESVEEARKLSAGLSRTPEHRSAMEGLAHHVIAQALFGMNEYAQGVEHELLAARRYREAGKVSLQNQLIAWGEAAAFQERLGNFGGAAQSYQKVAALAAQWQGPVRAIEVNIWCRAARFFVGSGKRGEGEALYRRAMQLADGGTVPDLAWIPMYGLAGLYLAINRFREAEGLSRMALEAALKLPTTSEAEIASVRMALGAAYAGIGRLVEAEEEFAAGSPVLRQSRDPVLGASLYWLAMLRVRQQRFDEADSCFKEATTFLLQWANPSDPTVLSVQADHVEMLRRAGRKREAKVLQKQFDENVATWNRQRPGDNTIDIRLLQ
jgi:tetratricopeptide (TPR) repeat protein